MTKSTDPVKEKEEYRQRALALLKQASLWRKRAGEVFSENEKLRQQVFVLTQDNLNLQHAVDWAASEFQSSGKEHSVDVIRSILKGDSDGKR